jgi:hypothetical protein
MKLKKLGIFNKRVFLIKVVCEAYRLMEKGGAAQEVSEMFLQKG